MDRPTARELAARSAEPALAFADLARRFGTFWALQRASGEIFPGEITALTGENGSGKSTLLLILAGILKPHRGRITLTAQGKLHLVSHQMMAYQDLTVLNNLKLAAMLGNCASDGILPALRYWRIEELADKALRTLSRGQLQRFLLSRAMLTKPDVLLLDEPFTGLDQVSEARLEDFMRAEARRGAAILFSDHHLTRARRLATRSIKIEKGVCGS
jgi:ABC-type multidrug transport system ATPase subunit